MPRRNAASCRIEWLQHGHPGVNKRKWTKKEQEALYKIAEKHGKRDWSTIAQELDVSVPVDNSVILSLYFDVHTSLRLDGLLGTV